MMFSMGNCVKTNKQDVASSQQGGKPRGAGVRDSSFTRDSRDRSRAELNDSRELEAREQQERKKKAEAAKNAAKEIVICVIGLDEAGKSTIAKVLKGDKDVKDTTPTVGYEPHEFKYGSSNMRIYDLGGGSRFRDVWKHYLAESYGFIYVIDSSNRNRINECRSVFSSFVENDKVAGKPILILANKQDQANALDESEIIQYMNVEELVNRFQIPCRIEPCIAFQGVANKMDPSLKSGFEWLIKHINVNMGELKTRVDYDTEVQRNREMRQRKEKYERVKQKRELENPDYYKSYDNDEYSASSNPWKAKDSKPKTSSYNSGYNDTPISAQDRQLLDEMRVSSPRLRLTTINEEKMKSKNRFLKSNKLAPYDDGSDYESYAKSKGTPSWTTADPLKRNLSARSRFES